MKNDIQSIRGQQILTALITVCQNHNNQATLQQLMKEVPEFMLEEIPESEISEVLRAYTSYEQAAHRNLAKSPVSSLTTKTEPIP